MNKAAKSPKRSVSTGSSTAEAISLGRYEVPMVARALQVLELVADSGGKVTLADVVAKTRITRSSAYRILQTLETRRYVIRDEASGDVTIGPRLDELQRLALSGDRLEVTALPLMQQLQEKFDETINLGVLRGKQMIYLRVLESQRRFRIRADEGDAAPLHASALGKAVLAFSPATLVDSLLEKHAFERFTANTIRSRARYVEQLGKVRAEGVAYDDEEIEAGASCIAAPVLDSHKQAVGAMSISGPTARVTDAKNEMRKALLHAVTLVARKLR